MNQCNGQERKHLPQLVAKRRLKLIFEIYDYFITRGLKAVIKIGKLFVTLHLIEIIYLIKFLTLKWLFHNLLLN